jgi:thiamine transporter ThiT
MKMETTKNQSMKVWIGCTLLAALAVVLQFITASFKIGEFSITFSLIPIIVATVFYGIKGGVIVGTVFGVTVIIQCITGMDLGGYFLFQLNPVFTVIACVFRAFLVGLLLGIIYKGISKA